MKEDSCYCLFNNNSLIVTTKSKGNHSEWTRREASNMERVR